MIKVDNKKTIRKVADTSFKADRMRNLFAVVAIVLTTILFSGLFTIAGSLMASMEESTMRQVGTSAHGGFKYLTLEQYEQLKKHPDIKEISYSVVLGVAENEELRKRQTEIRYAKDDLIARMNFSLPSTGRLPEKRNEIATDTLVLERLGIPVKLGEEVTLKYSVCGDAREETFTLVGFWEGDIVMKASQAWLSREYVEEVLGKYGLGTVEENSNAGDASEKEQTADGEKVSQAEIYVGAVMADANFANSRNIEAKILRVIEESGYTKDEIEYGVNWAYMGGSSLDIMTILGIMLVIIIIIFCGYLMISNVFLISVTKDIHFYGLLKTIGTTGAQMKVLLRRQAWLVSVMGIPVGLLLGVLTGSIITPYIFSILNTNIVKVSTPWWVFVFSSLFSLFTVFISIRKAAKIAAAVSPMEALRVADLDNKVKRKQKQTGKISLWRMAAENVGRNRKKAVLVTCSLSLSLIVLNVAYSMADSFDMDKYLNRMISSDFVMGDVAWFNVFSFYTEQDSLSDDFLKELSGQNGIESLEKIYFAEKRCELSEQWKGMEGRMEEELGLSGDGLKYANEEVRNGIGVYHVYGIDDEVWEKLTVWEGEIDLEKLYSGDYVVASPNYPYTEGSESGESVYKPGERVNVFTADGGSKSCEILAIASIPFHISIQHSHPIDTNLFLPSEVFVNMVADKCPMVVTMDVVDSEIDNMEKYLANYCENINPNMQYSSKATYVAEYENTQRTYKMVGIVVSVLLALIGSANFANTTITSIVIRKREFAMLESIGMTVKQQRNMLILEGMICMILTGAVTCTLGTLLGKAGLFLLISGSEAFTTRFTIVPSLVCMPFFLVLAVLIPVLSRKYISKESIVERLRRGE